jgi:hypothetical protein
MFRTKDVPDARDSHLDPAGSVHFSMLRRITVADIMKAADLTHGAAGEGSGRSYAEGRRLYCQAARPLRHRATASDPVDYFMRTRATQALAQARSGRTDTDGKRPYEIVLCGLARTFSTNREHIHVQKSLRVSRLEYLPCVEIGERIVSQILVFKFLDHLGIKLEAQK